MRSLARLATIMAGVVFASALAACADSEPASLLGPNDGVLTPAGPPGACSPWPACKDDGGGSTDPIPLSVTIPSGFDVETDGGGAYVHETEDVLAQIFGSDNFGLDVAARKKGKGNNKNVTDRRVCLTIRSPSDGSVLPREPGEESCLDLNVTTSQPDDPPGGFRLMATGETMTTRMRFLWGGPDGNDRWIRFGSKCELVDNQWTDVAETRAVVTATSDGWTIESSGSGAFWCKGNPDQIEPHPLADDPEGRVLVTVRFEATRL